MQAQTLEGGFAHPATDAAHAFRGVMEAMARPGTIQILAGATPPAPLSAAAGVALLTLCDTETPLYLAGEADCESARAWVAFHTGAPITGPSQCMFALGTWDALAPQTAYPIRTSEYPDRSATLIVECAALAADGASLTGPGIRDSASLSLPEIQAFHDNAALVPLGLDFVFTSGDRIAALPRFGASAPLNTGDMACDRRISAMFKDLPGGQVLGPTFDYTHRLLDFKLAAEGEVSDAPTREADQGPVPHVTEFLDREGLIEDAPQDDTPPPDLTHEPLEMPAARADEGFSLGLAYSTRRGYGRNHAFVRELRIGTVPVEMDIPELGFAIEIGHVTLTECETVNQFKGSKTESPQFTRGYGLVFGQTERGAISMALVDRALRWEELGEDYEGAPAQDTEFVVYHADNIQATGFLEHIKLPHYVDFQSELELVRKLRRDIEAPQQRRDAAE